MLQFGVSYSAANWIWSARLLVNPLIVGRYLGPESVAYVSLAMRLVEVLSFVRAATWRLSIAALAKVQGDLVRLRRIMEEATTLQVLGVAPFLCVGAVGVLVLPDLLGESWRPVIKIFPLIALGSLVNSVFSMHSSVLYVLKRNREVGLFHLVYAGLLGGGALLLVPTVGLIGYGLAEVVAMAAYVVIHRQVAKLFPLQYRASAPWFFVLAPPIFVASLPFPYALLLFLPVVVLLSLGRFRAVLAAYVGQLRP
jgi:PST family polysaccharide transporter